MHQQASKEQEKIQQITWFFLLVTWLMRCSQGLLLFQLYGSPFVTVEADNSFWIYHAFQIPYYIIHYQALGLFLDICWIGIVIYSLIRKQNHYLSVLMAILFLNYFILYNSVATHHEHQLVGLLFFNLLLIVKDLKGFTFVFAGIRYYVLFIMFSALCWKIWRGSIFQQHQMSEILKNQHIDYLISYPDAYYSNFISYLIDHPILSNLFWYGGWTIEGIFIIGFFTRKFDKVLGLAFLLFFFLDYCLMNLFFVEFCIFALVFYPWKGIWGYYNTKIASQKPKQHNQTT